MFLVLESNADGTPTVVHYVGPDIQKAADNFVAAEKGLKDPFSFIHNIGRDMQSGGLVLRSAGSPYRSIFLLDLEPDVEKHSPDSYYFAYDDDEGSDTFGEFWIVEKSFWERERCLDDTHIGKHLLLPDGFHEVMESVFEAPDDDIQKHIRSLISLGHVRKQDIIQ